MKRRYPSNPKYLISKYLCAFAMICLSRLLIRSRFSRLRISDHLRSSGFPSLMRRTFWQLLRVLRGRAARWRPRGTRAAAAGKAAKLQRSLLRLNPLTCVQEFAQTVMFQEFVNHGCSRKNRVMILHDMRSCVMAR